MEVYYLEMLLLPIGNTDSRKMQFVAYNLYTED